MTNSSSAAGMGRLTRRDGRLGSAWACWIITYMALVALGESLDGEDVVPGFALALAELFGPR